LGARIIEPGVGILMTPPRARHAPRVFDKTNPISNNRLLFIRLQAGAGRACDIPHPLQGNLYDSVLPFGGIRSSPELAEVPRHGLEIGRNQYPILLGSSHL
jgi:hypothetical protein